MAYRKDWGQPQAGPQGFARTMKVFGRGVNLATTDINLTGNIVGCFMVPAGFTLVSGVGNFPAMGAALTLSLGDAAAPGRILTANPIGAAGGPFPPALAPGAFLYRWNADTEIILTVTAQTGAPVAGVPTIFLQGFMW